MHFNVLAILGLTSIISASVILEKNSSMAILNKRVTYSCAGSSLCGVQANLRKWCDAAVNSQIIRNDVINYGAPGYICLHSLIYFNFFTSIVL
jgi:plasmid rolling circle replication initiator protein Rep